MIDYERLFLDDEDRNFTWPTESELYVHRMVRHAIGDGIPTPHEILDELEKEDG